MADGVVSSACGADGRLIGVMGVQDRGAVDLIRHAYVIPEYQGAGIGSRLLQHLCPAGQKPILIGTWQAADWAIRFYERHGFTRVAPDDARSEEHTSELQSLMRISYAVFCLKKKTQAITEHKSNPR